MWSTLSLPCVWKVFVIHQKNSNSRTTRAALRGDCVVPLRSSSFGQLCFSVRASQLWNQLPVEIRSCTSHNTFTYCLKDWLSGNQKCEHLWWYLSWVHVCLLLYIFVALMSNPWWFVWMIVLESIGIMLYCCYLLLFVFFNMSYFSAILCLALYLAKGLQLKKIACWLTLAHLEKCRLMCTKLCK